MPSYRVLLPVVLLALAPEVSRAQAPAPSPEQLAAVRETALLINTPAEFVLQHRKELALTDSQVKSLEQLASALRDSSVARGARAVQLAQQDLEQPDLAAAMEWTGPVDESAIREVMRRQSVVQAEALLAGARDRRLVGALLTSDQLAQLPALQQAMLVRAARRL